jgi:outer membrane protein assembly factor BamD (BamD/ComL family)
MLEYNYSCDLYDKKLYKESILWAKESYETFQLNQLVDSSKQVFSFNNPRQEL